MQPAKQSVAPLRVLIIDDHPFVLQGCARILEEARRGKV